MYFPHKKSDTKLSPLNPLPKQNLCDDSFSYAELSLCKLREYIASGDLSSQELTSSCMQHILNCNDTLHAMLDLNMHALAEAESCDLKNNTDEGRKLPLLGIPIIIKDNIEVKGLPNTAGSLALADLIATHDAPIVRALRRAGAVILGKSNMSEWAFYRSSSGISGWSGRGGRVCNPYALDRSTYGSSSGTAAAVSANFAPGGLGTETDGSIVGPAALCGIVGLKPTYGLLDGRGILPLAPSFDTPGPMAKYVSDVALMLDALTGTESSETSYAGSLACASLDHVRLALVDNGLSRHSRIAPLIENVLALLQERGAICSICEEPAEDSWRKAERDAFEYEFQPALENYLKGQKCKLKTLEDIIVFNREHTEELKYFDQDLLEASCARTFSDDQGKLLIATAKRCATASIEQMLKSTNSDFVIAVETVPAWPVDYVNGDIVHEVSGSPAAVAGYPSITVPLGFVGGLPVGLLFIGRPYSERELLKTALAFEQATRQRQPPQFYSTLEF